MMMCLDHEPKCCARCRIGSGVYGRFKSNATFTTLGLVWFFAFCFVEVLYLQAGNLCTTAQLRCPGALRRAIDSVMIGDDVLRALPATALA